MSTLRSVLLIRKIRIATLQPILLILMNGTLIQQNGLSIKEVVMRYIEEQS